MKETSFIGIELNKEDQNKLLAASEKTFQSKRQFVKQAVIERIKSVEGEQ